MLEISEGGMVSLLNTQVAGVVPYCQSLGHHIMVPSPRGWPFSRLTMQMVFGPSCQLLGDHCNALRSQELAVARWHGQPAEHAGGSCCACHIASPREMI
jgi:hypothetical protein